MITALIVLSVVFTAIGLYLSPRKTYQYPKGDPKDTREFEKEMKQMYKAEEKLPNIYF